MRRLFVTLPRAHACVHYNEIDVRVYVPVCEIVYYKPRALLLARDVR